ncbi:MAG: XTP/dITP diphosphatase [Lachnospiraceae bacterium]|nr:XTP/dITP diphosphatase [Lachnospiraceae bacterium]
MSEKKVILASTNKGKLREVREILDGTGFSVIPLSETGFEGEIEENGSTFEENAFIKAEAVAKALGVPVLADDSGLEIDALGGEPGIRSARFMGRETPYSEKNAAILENLKDVPEEKRSARFVCAMAMVYPDGRCLSVRETMEGRIAYEIAGANGFGYDPIFFLPEYNMTSAEITPEEKNAISHRGKALRKMAALIAAEQ